MRKIAIIATALLSFLSTASARAQDGLPKLTFGAEWSCTASFFTAYHFNYFSPDGYRCDQKELELEPTLNGEGLVHVGYDVNEKWNLALYTGFTGISKMHNAIPLSFRATRMFTPNMHGDRWLAFADAGTGLSLKRNVREMFAVKLGSGYRFSLSRDSKLDFLASARCTYTHPEIYFEQEPISQRWINRNDALVVSVAVGMSVTF